MTRHLSTRKHNSSVDGIKMELNYINLHINKHQCNCGKEYKSQSGLWKHQQKCNIETNNQTNNHDNNQSYNQPNNVKEKTEICDKELIITLLKQNAELLEIIKNGTNNMQITNNNHTNCNNKTFNLHVFLNETCKDAMNLSEFIENIKLQLSDLENIGKLGYVEGISNIIIKSLNALDVEKRPMHCSDVKREIIYVKDDDEWQKEQDDKTRIKSVISSVVSKNLGLLPEFQKKYPDYLKPDSKKSDEYNQIIMETMGGVPGNGEKNKEKIIRNIAKKVVIDKIG
jgi:hypothetical protein